MSSSKSTLGLRKQPEPAGTSNQAITMEESAQEQPVSDQAGEKTANTSPTVVLSNVSKVFPDGTEALVNISFELRQGEFLTIVGPSGCGKSTILRIISGLLKPTDGDVSAVDGLGYVFQDPTLLPWRTVQKNVELFAELRGVPKEERRAAASEAIELVGLKGFEKHHPNALSGGMRMRVSVARSLTLNPQLFLFDEPFGALDQITRDRLNQELLELFLRERFASLFVTHSIFEAVYLSTRILVMSPRPGRFIKEFKVPFSYPRSFELRFDSSFSEFSSKVSRALEEGYEL